MFRSKRAVRKKKEKKRKEKKETKIEHKNKTGKSFSKNVITQSILWSLLKALTHSDNN